ncbi:hypothetical protein [Algoriphagus zhangzhouensis]|uniref:Uncharacterized protein n=1 Tax=Algoriphagus zhangzhouensis TaxID=1073327 RepID=A0A1M7ZG95_9BACT|nr:hypothetical protein [Algoriphagus zhangzhouensis]TDY44815.1 hypothetical protein A8938_3026 [Algoriphagus zhangzhouensis]SHO63893.1 hypothetical protein SAMN04488108_3059 [Algoriphagus zhangzhouensis]
MLTIEKIKKDFSRITAWTGNSETYHDSPIFEGYGNFCDLYFISKDKQIKQEQVDKYNEFKENFKSYLPDIEKYILSSLKNSEVNLENLIRQTKLTLEVIEIPFDNFNYDLVLVCGKTYKKFFFLTKNIDIRVEFKNGRIKSIQRKKDTTEENE